MYVDLEKGFLFFLLYEFAERFRVIQTLNDIYCDHLIFFLILPKSTFNGTLICKTL